MSLCFPTLAASALGFTAALAWNNALSRCVESVLPVARASAAHVALASAILVTVAVLVVAHFLRRALGPNAGTAGCAVAPAPAPAPTPAAAFASGGRR